MVLPVDQAALSRVFTQRPPRSTMKGKKKAAFKDVAAQHVQSKTSQRRPKLAHGGYEPLATTSAEDGGDDIASPSPPLQNVEKGDNSKALLISFMLMVVIGLGNKGTNRHDKCAFAHLFVCAV